MHDVACLHTLAFGVVGRGRSAWPRREPPTAIDITKKNSPFGSACSAVDFTPTPHALVAGFKF